MNLILVNDNNSHCKNKEDFSPLKHKNYRDELPEEVRCQAEYGPGIRVLISILKTKSKMSEKR
jgi:hypothetical protein